MASWSIQQEEMARRGFRQFNRFMILLWRLGLGRMMNAAPEHGGRILVLVHTGRTSGRRYHTPVNYAAIGEAIYCTAGFGSISDWYRNVMAEPNVELWLPDGRWLAVAQDVSESPDRLRLLREVLIASGFAAGAVGLSPREMSDDALAAATEAYRLLRLVRTEPATGPDGPGELAWVWPVGALVVLVGVVAGIRFAKRWVRRR